MLFDDLESLERARRDLVHSEATANECHGIAALYQMSARRCRADDRQQDADLCDKFAALWLAAALVREGRHDA